MGNVRVSYTKDLVDGLTKIVEENNYYPFGLKHANYNSYVPVNTYNYKFQGQERQDEFGLGWDSFKWRNYDYAIGRFMSIDPLAEKYNTWSPYTFSGNRLIDARELEGLEPHSIHKTLVEAGNNFVSQYNGLSIRMKGEVGVNFYSKVVNGEKVYSYIQPVGYPGAGGVDADAGVDQIPKGGQFVAKGHTHKEDLNLISKDKNGKMISNESNMFSEQDLNISDEIKKDITNFEGMFVGTPNGKVLFYKPTGKKGDERKKDMERTSNQVPSDPNSSTRANNISPNFIPKVLPYGTSNEDLNNLNNPNKLYLQ